MAVLECPELVSKHISPSNRALRNAIDTIHLIRVQLADAVPVDSRAILIIIVPDMDDELVTPASLNQRPGKLFVEDLPAGLLKSVREQCHVPIHLEEVFPRDTYWRGIEVLVCKECERQKSEMQHMLTHN